jgi:hypothetical protein
MGYVIAAVLVLLIVAGFVTFVVLNSMRKGSRGGGPPGIEPDHTPLGDTAEHAGSQTSGGHTADDPETAARGVDPATSETAADEPAGGGDRPVPDSERLANRPR